MSNLFHGILTTTIFDGSKTVEIKATSVICAVVTAPEAVETGDYAFPLNYPVQINSEKHGAQLTYNNATGTGEDGGTAADALNAIYAQCTCPVIFIRVATGADAATDAVNAAGSLSAGTGIYAALNAQSVLGIKPKLLCAPGLQLWSDSTAANTLVSALMTVADKLKAVAVLDGPNTTQADAVTAAESVSGTRSRAFMVDPYVMNGTDTLPAAGYVAGLIAKTDQEDYYGYAASPSNRSLNGVTGTSRPIASGFEGSEGDTLNSNHIAVITNQGNGYILWGNRTLEKENSQIYFLVARRTVDIVEEAIEAAHKWAMGNGIRSTLVEDVVETVNAFLRQLTASGRILGGECWADPELNTTETLNGGKLYIDYDLSAVPPLELLTFNCHVTGQYASEIL